MKKSILIGLVFTAVIGIISYQALQKHTQSENTQKNITEEIQRTPAEENGYCLAIRGNGELEPAHWGALARTVEQLGLPTSMAGGSSATISMFLMEAIASHPLVKNQPSEIQMERASFLLKSLLGFFTELQKTQSWSDVKSLFGTYEKTQQMEWLQKVGTFIKDGQLKPALSTLNKAVEIGVLDVHLANPLISALKSLDQSRAQFYWGQIMETASVFGKFDAAHDDNLFFRAGIVNFETAASTFGKIAGFYASSNQASFDANKWQALFDQCARNSKERTWNQIIASNPQCSDHFHALFQNYFSNHVEPSNFADRQIGQVIKVYPTTTVLTGSAAEEFRQAMADYHKNLNPHFGKTFAITNPEEVRFGYWGRQQDLQRISRNLDASDEKSRRFLALGSEIWRQVLSLSPAEPGLSPLKEFSASGQHYISAGGWSDLHPVLILKASGCKQVVYLTRQGGESLFAQGVAKRLLNLSRDWSLLESDQPQVPKLNDEGDATDMNSLWSRLYNLANPSSSVNRSLAQASAVLCTNWNAFDVKKDLVGLIEDSYKSSFWINRESAASLRLSPALHDKKAGCAPR